MSKLTRVLIAALMLSALAATPARADGVEVKRTGHGTLGSFWELELDREYRIEVDFEVNASTQRAGHTWRIVMRHNGATFFNGTRIANGLGDFEVERTVANLAGTDTIRVRAVDQRNGEVVVAVASI